MVDTTDLKEVPSKIEEVVHKALTTEAPLLTVRNHRQLCGAGAASRTFCLVLVDMTSTKQISEVVGDLAKSRTDYAKELAEIRDADESGEGAPAEDNFRIQAVRVMTGSSRFPSAPFGVSSEFYTAWTAVGREPMFLLEVDTQRAAPV